MLGVARELAPAWPAVELTLLDRLALVDGATVAEYARLRLDGPVERRGRARLGACGNRARADAAPRWDLVIANLFLHHFDGAELAPVLGAIAASTDEFIACEPRRGWLRARGQSPGRRARRQRGDAHRRGAERARGISRA